MEQNTTVYNDTETTTAVLRAKVITMVCLFSISMFVGSVPLLISMKFDWFTKSKSQGTDIRSSNKLVRGLLWFGGGVLFATTFMHLLPEVEENIELLQEEGEMIDFPLYLAGLIMCCGFFMMYLIEELVHLYINSRENNNTTNFTRVLSIKRDGEEGKAAESHVKTVESGHGHSHSQPIVEDDSVASALRGLLVVLALSIHELFEGLAVGLESNVSNVWYMFAAVSAHKYLIAFCVGVELLAANTKRWLSLVYIFIYSFVSALGIGVGILLVGGASAADSGIYSVVLQGIACGTLVYVVFFEVWRQDQTSLMTFFCAILGFSVMVLLELIVELSV